MPGKMARISPRPPFGLPEVPVAVRTSRLSFRVAAKALNIHPSLRVMGGIPATCCLWIAEIMTRIKQFSISATVALIASLTGMPVLAQDIPPGWDVDGAKCFNTFKNVWAAPSASDFIENAIISLLQRIRPRAFSPAKMEIRASRSS